MGYFPGTKAFLAFGLLLAVKGNRKATVTGNTGQIIDAETNEMPRFAATSPSIAILVSVSCAMFGWMPAPRSAAARG